MSGKKGTTRTSTLKDAGQLKKQIARMAAKWGWSVSEFVQYLLRMGVNRVMALERYAPGGAKKKTKKKPAKKAKAKPAKKAKSKVRKPSKKVNHVSKPATAAPAVEASSGTEG